MRLLRERSPQKSSSPTADAPSLRVVPDLVEGTVLVEELATTVEAELAVGGADVSLVDEIAQAEDLVSELDAEVHGGSPAHTPARERWRNADGKTDDDLVMEARGGDEAALCELLNKYRAFARVKARSYFLVGADREDIVQEGMIGLYKAIRDFRHDKETSFRSFAELCVTRQIITAIKSATRYKHAPLNTYISFSHTPAGQESDGECTLGDALPGPSIDDPSVRVISTEELHALVGCLGTSLSGLESEALRLYLDGNSYESMADRLGCDCKTIDNALQRVKRKILAHQATRAVPA